MQGLQQQQQQQQLASLLSAALSKPDTTTSTTATENDESSRVAAVNSLHRAIIYSPNSLVVSHSAPFLSQGLSQLLSDKSFLVRQHLCQTPDNHVMLGSLVDRFIA